MQGLWRGAYFLAACTRCSTPMSCFEAFLLRLSHCRKRSVASTIKLLGLAVRTASYYAPPKQQHGHTARQRREMSEESTSLSCFLPHRSKAHCRSFG